MREIVEAGKPDDDDDPMLSRRRGSAGSVRSPRVHNILRAAAEEVEGLRREEALASIAGVRSPCAGFAHSPTAGSTRSSPSSSPFGSMRKTSAGLLKSPYDQSPSDSPPGRPGQPPTPTPPIDSPRMTPQSRPSPRLTPPGGDQRQPPAPSQRISPPSAKPLAAGLVSSSFVAAQQPPGHLQRRSGRPKWGGASTASSPSADASPSSDGVAAGCAAPSCAGCAGGTAAQPSLSSPRTTKRPPRAPGAEEAPRDQSVEAQPAASPSPPRDEPGTGARRRWQMALSRMDEVCSPARGEAHEVPSPPMFAVGTAAAFVSPLLGPADATSSHATIADGGAPAAPTQRGAEDRSEASLEHDEFAALLQKATREWRAADEEADELAQQTLAAEGGSVYHQQLQRHHARGASPSPTTLLQAEASLPASPPPPVNDASLTSVDDRRTVHFQEPLER